MYYVNERMEELINLILKTRFSDLDIDFKSCHELLLEAQRCDSEWGVAFAYTYLGDYYIAVNNITKSGEYLIRAKEICLRQAFEELYMQVCHFFGIYHSLLYDEQAALNYYLDGLKLAELYNNLSLKCLILNNIAHLFQCRDAFDEANKYYFEALKSLNDANDPQDNRKKILILYNITDLFLFLKDLPMAEKYLHECEEVVADSEHTQSYKELLVSATKCTLAAVSKSQKEAVLYAKQLIKYIAIYEDKHAVSGVMYSVCKAMIELEEQDFSWKLLKEWGKVCTHNETFNIHRLMSLKISYHNIFSNEDVQNQAFREYFYDLRKAAAIESKVRTDGMNAQIYLREILEKQEFVLKENQLLESVANKDELTGIYNRRFINKIFSKIENDISVKRVAIIMLDVDYFKEYNDKYGHAKGDEVLIAVATTLSKFICEGIWIGRYGGDEFICVCVNLSDKLIKRFIENVYAELALLSITHEASRCNNAVVTLSGGYSSKDVSKGLNVAMLVAAADKALYVSKFRGRDQWSKSK